MVNLEVGIDASKIVSGSREGFQALVQLTNATRHLMAGLEEMNGSAGALGRFGSLMSRLSPHLLAVTTGLGAVSLAMGVFGGKAGEAADAQERFAEALAKGRREQELAARLGESQLPGVKSQAASLREALGSVSAPVSAGAFSRTSGMTQNQILQWLAVYENDQEALGILDNGRFQRRDPVFGVDDITPSNFGSARNLTTEQQKAMLTSQYQAMNSQAARLSGLPSGADMSSWSNYPGSLSSRGPMGQPVGMGLNFPAIDSDARAGNWSRGWNGVSQSENEQFAVSQEKQREQQQQQLETMREIEQSAQNIGNTLGAAATQFITKMATLREIGQQLATMALQSGLSQAFTAGARGIFGSFGASAAQRTPGVDP